MHLFKSMSYFITRLRYPGSLPEEVAIALGIEITNGIKFSHMLKILTSPTTYITTLTKNMPRELAEKQFKTACYKERFGYKTLFSYSFPQGYMEFELEFDMHSKLRRIYLHHRLLSFHEGIELGIGKK